MKRDQIWERLQNSRKQVMEEVDDLTHGDVWIRTWIRVRPQYQTWNRIYEQIASETSK